MALTANTKSIIIGAIALGSLCICPLIGMEFISPFGLKADALQSRILFSLRIPRCAMAFLAGGGLSLCGLVLQAMFRNPLVEPFTVGIASGASCGAALTILLGVSAMFPGVPVISLGAFSGALLAILLVYGLSRLPGKSDSLTMLLAGVAVSFLFSSLLMFIQYLSNMRDSFHIVRWLMGGLEVFGFQAVGMVAGCMLIGSTIIAWKLPELDHLLSGEDIARSRGVDVGKTKFLLLLAITLIVGSIVAQCGPIGFVGLIIPYISRRYFKINHKVLAPVSFACGGTFLVISDTLARTIIAPTEIPVGVITALFGAPFFLWILIGDKNNRQKGMF